MITVIIPAFNEEATIGKTLQSLVNQKYSKKYEVLIVNNNSTDDTSKVASKFKNKLNLKIINEKRKGRGNARATGAEKAKGDILAYIDADSEASDNWLCVIERELVDGVAAITGPWKFSDATGFTKFMERFQNWAQVFYLASKKHYWLNGMNMAISKNFYDKTVGFNRNLNAHEDIQITNELRQFGKIKFVKNMWVYTSGRRYKLGFLKGLWSYQKPWIEHFIFKKKKISLKDFR